MNYSGLYHFDVLNGLGFRTSLFVSGCDKQPKCCDCQNPQAWCHTYGEPFTDAILAEIIQSLKHPAVRGLSLLGGEPSDNLADGALFGLLEAVRQEAPGKDIWAWSGYTWEELQQDALKRRFLTYLDAKISTDPLAIRTISGSSMYKNRWRQMQSFCCRWLTDKRRNHGENQRI